MNIQTDTSSTCRHCQRTILSEDGLWIDPAATGDDSIWRETCDAHDTFIADHEPSYSTLTYGDLPLSGNHSMACANDECDDYAVLYSATRGDYFMSAADKAVACATCGQHSFRLAVERRIVEFQS